MCNSNFNMLGNSVGVNDIPGSPVSQHPKVWPRFGVPFTWAAVEWYVDRLTIAVIQIAWTEIVCVSIYTKTFISCLSFSQRKDRMAHIKTIDKTTAWKSSCKIHPHTPSRHRLYQSKWFARKEYLDVFTKTKSRQSRGSIVNQQGTLWLRYLNCKASSTCDC